MKDLRRDVGHSSRNLLGDVEQLVKDARRDAGKLEKAIVADLAKLQQAVRDPGRATVKRNAGGAAARKPSKAKKAPAAKR
jgi:hypothetical protein